MTFEKILKDKLISIVIIFYNSAVLMYFQSNKRQPWVSIKRRQKHLADPKPLNSCVASGSQLVYLLFDLAGAVVLVGGCRHGFFLHHPHKTQLRLSVE